MSTRREADDVVYLKPNSGFCGESDKIGAVRLLPDTDDSCMLDCGDPDCTEWDVWSEERGGGLYHVSECQMLDQPYNGEA